MRCNLVEEVEEFGAAAVFLDYYVVRWTANNHPHPVAAGVAQPRQRQHPPAAETLN